MSRKIDEGVQTLALSIDPNSYKTLVHMKFKAFWGLGRISFWGLGRISFWGLGRISFWELGRISFWTLKDKKKQPEGESTTSKPPSQ
jgi:hypothetical protein